ncbi:MAG: TIGR03986 family CRISPR-associated RAMP protein [Candidatus Cloacimonadaceae bacterium]|nr:TIGR03986 family CRISPR-associated RAMP protein [Candidatus Cloacimonadota bacterium]MCK9242076.1 TIGR03986 family CRISPR-associated RAMP protein [Candidatus Cloacimonadota bacterium]
MEKGKLSIRRKDKKVILELIKEDGKTLPISDGSLRKAENWEGIADGEHDVSYILEGGSKVTELTIGDKTIKSLPVQAPPQADQRNRGYHGNARSQGNPNNIDSAKAPYNFIPLNEEVLSVTAEEIPAFNACKGLDGYIDLEITAQSPVYIRRNLSAAELKREEELGHNNNSQAAMDFKESLSGFNRPLGGTYRIPGSSLRGMIRTMYEVATYSKMTMLDDHKLYFRSFADASTELRQEYSSRMIDNVGGAYLPKVSAGFLRKVRQDYEISEASSFHRVEESLVLAKGIISEKMKFNRNYNDLIKRSYFKIVCFKADKETNHQHSEGQLFYSKVTEITKFTEPIPEGYHKGWLVLTGWVPSRREGKHMHWVISEPTTNKYTVPRDLVEDYRKDVNRKGTNLLEKTDREQIPCFYIIENSQVKAFGHTGMFRMVYDKSTGDLRPQAHKSNDLDMTEAVFGRITDKDIRPGRVFFEDALCIEARETEAAQYPKILSGPKPSTFQHYLQQANNQIRLIKGKPVGLKNYNSDGARLAGHKFYWHRNRDNWIAEDQEVRQHRTQYTRIHPLDTGSVFGGRIRFMNLSPEELGALLFVLNLPDGCCHKLGMAKPLGLGSVRIKASLCLIDRNKRYTDLLSLGIQEDDGAAFVQAFVDMLRTKLKMNQDNPWNSDRLKELKRMLDFTHKPHHDKTRYMEIERGKAPGIKGDNEYKNRPILKKPSQIQ